MCRRLGVDLSGQTSASYNMRVNYEKCLLDFENYLRAGLFEQDVLAGRPPTATSPTAAGAQGGAGKGKRTSVTSGVTAPGPAKKPPRPGEGQQHPGGISAGLGANLLGFNHPSLAGMASAAGLFPAGLSGLNLQGMVAPAALLGQPLGAGVGGGYMLANNALLSHPSLANNPMALAQLLPQSQLRMGAAGLGGTPGLAWHILPSLDAQSRAQLMLYGSSAPNANLLMAGSTPLQLQPQLQFLQQPQLQALAPQAVLPGAQQQLDASVLLQPQAALQQQQQQLQLPGQYQDGAHPAFSTQPGAPLWAGVPLSVPVSSIIDNNTGLDHTQAPQFPLLLQPGIATYAYNPHHPAAGVALQDPAARYAPRAYFSCISTMCAFITQPLTCYDLCCVQALRLLRRQ